MSLKERIRQRVKTFEIAITEFPRIRGTEKLQIKRTNRTREDKSPVSQPITAKCKDINGKRGKFKRI